jgi:ribonuclease-3 family protein
MEESIRNAFGLSKVDLRQASPLMLAFVGDAVFELVVRTKTVQSHRVPPRRLHVISSSYACASAQARMSELVAGLLTDEEKEILRRGRNAHASSISKSASVGEYRKATGWESLIGYLYLDDREDRAVELIMEGIHALDAAGGHS